MSSHVNKQKLYRYCAKAAMTSLCVLGASIQQAAADPTGGVVVAGDVDFNTLEGSPIIGVTQNTPSAIVEWQSFDLSDGESFFFDQPTADAIILNRILGEGSSLIDGALTANGNVVFVNGDGIIFGANSTIDVNGLLATTTDIANADFMAGNFNFEIPGEEDASVINRGVITAAEAGLAAFVAPNVANEGVIYARLGKVSLAAGERFTLDFFGDGLVAFSSSASAGTQLGGVDVIGPIIAEGGVIQLSATDAAAFIETVINVEADLIARSAYQEGGRIILAGTEKTIVNVDATLDASGADGGEITISGNEIYVAAGAELLAEGLAPLDGLLWTFQNAGFGGVDTGTALTGSFIYDAATNTYSAIEVLTGFGASLPGAAYIAPGPAPSAGQIDFVSTMDADITDAFRLYIGFDAPLTDAGGTLSIIYGAEVRCLDMTCGFPGFGPNARGLIGSTSIFSSPIPFDGMQDGGTIEVMAFDVLEFAGAASTAPGPDEGMGGDIVFSADGVLALTGMASIGDPPRQGSLTIIEPETPEDMDEDDEEPEDPDDMDEELNETVEVTISEIAATGNSTQSQAAGTGGGASGWDGQSESAVGGLWTLDSEDGGGEKSEDEALMCLHGVSEAACGNTK